MTEVDEISKQALRIMLSLVIDKPNIHDEVKQKFQDICKKPEYLEDATNNSKPLLRAEVSDSNIRKRILNFENPTLIVNIGTFAFNVNMEVLEMYSEYMRKNNESKEITLPDTEVSPIAFVAIYEWIITENPGLPRKGIVELYKAASYLGVKQLLAQFWECVSNPLIVEDRAYLLYLEALAFDVPEIRKAMLNRVSKFFLPIVSCEEFLHIPSEDLSTLLKSNLVCVNSELEIYYTCVRYFNYDWEQRRASLLPIMKLIRFDFLPTNFVLELLNHDTDFVSKEVSRIVDHPELQDILRDLMHYHCLIAFPGPNSVLIEESMHRNWIFDTQCNYHSRENPRKTNPEFISYMEFVTYLGVLNLSGAKHWENFEQIQAESQSMSSLNCIKWEVLK